MTAPESTSALLLELSPNAAMLERLPKTRWSQPCPCSLSCSVLLEAEAAAMAAGRRQLWLLIHPGALEWHWEGPSLLILNPAADPCGHPSVSSDPSAPGLPVPECLGFGFGKFAPMAQRVAVNECWKRLSKAVSQCMKILEFFLYPQTLSF